MMLSPNSTLLSSPMAMDDNSARKLCRSSSFPYTSLSKSSSRPPPSGGFMASSTKPSALLQRRSRAGHGFPVSAVNTNNAISDPPPATRSTHSTAYEVLQISPSASQQEIKIAFWRLARQHHPDKVPFEQKDASTLTFLQIHSAYVALKDPEARARHDAQMAMESFQVSGSKQSFSGMSVDVKAPFTYKTSTNIYTPRRATEGQSPTPFTPRPQIFTPSATSYGTPRSHFQAPKSASTGASPNYYTPHSPYTPRRSWETDQCW